MDNQQERENTFYNSLIVFIKDAEYFIRWIKYRLIGTDFKM